MLGRLEKNLHPTQLKSSFRRESQDLLLSKLRSGKEDKTLLHSDRASELFPGQALVQVAVRKLLGSSREKYEIQILIRDNVDIPSFNRMPVTMGAPQDIFSVDLGDRFAEELKFVKFLPEVSWQKWENETMVFKSSITNQAIGCFFFRPGLPSRKPPPETANLLIVLGIYNHKAWTDILDGPEIQSHILEQSGGMKLQPHQVYEDFMKCSNAIERVRTLYGPNGKRSSNARVHFAKYFKPVWPFLEFVKLQIVRGQGWPLTQTGRRGYLNQGISDVHVNDFYEYRKPKVQNVSKPDELKFTENIPLAKFGPIQESPRTLLECILLNEQEGFRLLHKYPQQPIPPSFAKRFLNHISKDPRSEHTY